jgi:hypothetical protein
MGMLEMDMDMVEMAMELGKAMGKELRSNHSPTPSRRWLTSLKNYLA